MALEQLKKQLAGLKMEIYQEGFLNEQFTVLQRCQESDPGFTVEMAKLYFQDAEVVVNDLTLLLGSETVDFSNVGELLHKLKGSSMSLGAQRVSKVCEELQVCSKEINKEGCLNHLQQLKEEISLLKDKLEFLFVLEKLITTVGDN
ncbi:histidine-containing phosphotransfer protein 1-like [Typha angustifolia]|uniref:histidine-containing phosphotransfer protein 1-like n=1 Tax=Typha angustifolia TaxID=59011 RepID=UPI003C2B0658